MRTRRNALILLLVGLAASACERMGEREAGSHETPSHVAPVPVFAGRPACTGCHAREAEAWDGSHHDLALQVANGRTVLGDFSGATLDDHGSVARFVERDGKHIVETADGSGQPSRFAVKYTFGVEPLQQYLVELPGGRLQALPFAWDTRPRARGGQRWFQLYAADEIRPGDPLFWSGREHNWNYMCAECHSTQVVLAYDAKNDTFDTTWKEPDVSCEACHGPGSVHVAQAESASFDAAFGLSVNLDDRGNATWQMDAVTGIARRSEPRTSPPAQPDACGRCHSRRYPITPEYAFGRPLADTHQPAMIDEPLYFPDGQVRDEVYVYGSFLQSRMYRAGVSCSNCHDPHSLDLVTGADANAVCAQCHSPSRFAVASHLRHAPDTAGCVDCHMPERVYMTIDARRDHSFRVPRPDLTRRLGTPNACNGCHTDRDAAWAEGAVADWYGSTVAARPEFATALAASRDGHANEALRAVMRSADHPPIARASALTHFDLPLSGDDVLAIGSAMHDPDPLVRVAAYRALRLVAPEQRSQFGFAGLADPVRSVRIEAALTFAGQHDLLPSEAARNFRTAAEEYRAAYEHTANRPESLTRLGDFELAMGNLESAARTYGRALALEPGDMAARLNLADIHRARGNEEEGERLLRDGIGASPSGAALRHALGLLLVRTGRPGEGLVELDAAARLEPDDRRFAYVHAVAVNSLGDTARAISLLESARRRFPNDFDINWALATMYRDAGRTDEATRVAHALRLRHPDDGRVLALHRSLTTTRPGN